MDLTGSALLQLRRFEAAAGLRLDGLEELARHLEVIVVPARQPAMAQGEHCPYVHIVRSGLLKQVYVDAEGRERIKSFTADGDLFACVYALEGQPATFSSVAIRTSHVERIPFRLLEQAAERSAAWQKALRIAFQALARIKVDRERDLLSLTPRQLYEDVRTRAPHWLDAVPQKDLAAYFGVTPVGLNRIIRSAARPSGPPGD